MNCADCGYGVPPDFAFCPRCGSRLNRTCGNCGSVHPPDFAFCPRCGTALGPAVAPAQQRPEPPPRGAPTAGAPTGRESAAGQADRRPATILFADLSGFTTVSERLDPEVVRAIQIDLFDALSAVIVKHEGFVEKFAGDAVLAVFGAPVAHEDDPERALRAAIAMHAAVARMSTRWEKRIGESLSLHVGVNTGPVVAGALGSTGPGDYVVTGDAVNTASRLQGAAGPGETLVSEATWRLSQHAFAFEPLGEIAMKGKVRPVPVFRLTSELESRRPSRGLEGHGLTSTLVGRDEELARLESAFARTQRGHAQIVSLVGEAGIGKARLIEAFLHRLESTDRLATVSVRRATCSPVGEQSYGVIATLCREAYELSAEDTLEEARRKVALGLERLGGETDETARATRIVGYILGLDDPEDPLREVEPEQLQRQILMALHSLVARRLQQGPLLLVIEDLHRADSASVGALRSIMERFSDRPVMLLTDFRPDFEVSALLTSRATHTAIRLRRLTAADCHAMLDAFFGPSRDDVPGPLRDLIVERAGGHPLYVEEIVRGLIADGTLVEHDGRWTRARGSTPEITVPHTIRALLLSRIDRLAPEVRALLLEASVLGPLFDHGTLHELAGEGARIDRSLQALIDAELIAELPLMPGESPDSWRRRYRFTHGLIHEVAYSSLLTARRVELHGKAGRVLEARRGRSDATDRLEDLVALGHQLSLSSEPAKGARYLIEAGDRARAVHANDDAVRLYGRGLEALESGTEAEALRSVACERLADLLGTRGDRGRALDLYESLCSAAVDTGDRPTQARMHRKIGGLHWESGERVRAHAHFRLGLDILESAGDHIELAHLYQEMGRLAFRGGDHRGAVEWANRSLVHADTITSSEDRESDGGDELSREVAAVRSHAHNTLGIALARQGRLAEAVKHIERSVQVAEERALLPAACRGYANLGVLYSTISPRKAIDTCRAGLESARRIGHLGLESQLQANLAVAYCALTDRCGEEGRTAAQLAADLDRQLGQLDHLAVPLIVLGQIHQCNGQWRPAFDYYTEALSIAERSGEPQLLFPCLDGLGTLLLEAGEPERAEPYMSRAQSVCELTGVDPDSLIILPFLS